MAKLTPKEVAQLRRTIHEARGGRASLPELAAAHELAQKAGLLGCAAEVRAHVRALAADHHEDRRKVERDVAVGVLSGVVTHLFLGGIL